MKKTGKTLAIAVALSIAASSAAFAEDCASDVVAAQSSARNMYVQGMSGLAQNNFSQRPGSFSALSCLDKFMQGNMDIFFRPPALNDLLQQALSFACQQVAQQITGGATGDLSMLGSLSGGLSIGGTPINLANVFGGGSSSGSSVSGSMSNLWRR